MIDLMNSNDLRRMLEVAWREAQATGEGLRSVLNKHEAQLEEATEAGVLASSSVGGQSYTVALGGGPGASVATPLDKARAWTQLVHLYDIVKALNPDADESGIFGIMLGALSKPMRTVVLRSVAPLWA